MPVHRGNLKDEDKAKITENYTFLLNELDGRFLVNYLYEQQVFNSEDKEDIYSQKTRQQSAELFLEKLCDSGPGKAYSVFLKILRETYPHVAKRLDPKAEIHDEETMNIIMKVFLKYVEPTDTLLKELQSHSVLEQEDLEVVTSKAKNDGSIQAAEELLNRLMKSKDWFSCLIKVLKDPQVKLEYVVEKIWEELGVEKIWEGLETTDEKKDSINLTKNKALTATAKLDQTDLDREDFLNQHGLKCLRYISQTYVAYPSLRQVIGDWLGDYRCAAKFVNVLKKEMSEIFFGVRLLPVTFEVCSRYSGVSSKFAKSLAEAGVVKLLTDAITDERGIFRLNMFDQGDFVTKSMTLLRHIAQKAGKISQFKDSKTVEALMSLTTHKCPDVKVKVMLTLVELVEDEEKDKLTDTSDIIEYLAKWIHQALEKIKDLTAPEQPLMVPDRHRILSEDEAVLDLTASELSLYLARLVVNDVNHSKITEFGMFDPFLTTLRNTDSNPDKLEKTIQCLGTMATNERIRETIKDNTDLILALEELRKTQYANVKKELDLALKRIHGQT